MVSNQSLIIPRKSFGGNHKTATVRLSVSVCVCPESDLRDGWMELDDILDSDAESQGAGARLSKIQKFSFLAKLGQIFFKILAFFCKMS